MSHEYQEPRILPPGPLCQPAVPASHSRWHAFPHGLWNQQISQVPGSGALDSLASRVGWGETEKYPFSPQKLLADKLTGGKNESTPAGSPSSIVLGTLEGGRV